MKTVFISGMLPSGHYSHYITNGISSQEDVNLLVYADKRPENLKIKNCGIVKNVWSKSPKYIIEILKEIKKDKPDIIHLQHELNMYGGALTASLFPILLLILRIFRFKIVVTVHAAVFKRQIDKKFIQLFHQDSFFIVPLTLKLFFHYIYKSISFLSDDIIVHTNLTKEVLTKDYGVYSNKIEVIPIAIPQKEIDNSQKEKYLFYFGYMVRRKGLGYALEGFKRFIKNNPESEFKLVLAGGVIKGQKKAFEEIKEMIVKNNLKERVIIKGFIEETEQDDLYRKAHAVIIPAEISMGSSGPLFHSVSYGKCVICSKVGHFLEDVIDGKTGVLIENNKWEDAFQFVVDNPEKVSYIESNVEKKARIRTPNITARKYIEIYKKNIL
jgi:glycosyltransferase involved in cell wall biosynthesis